VSYLAMKEISCDVILLYSSDVSKQGI